MSESLGNSTLGEVLGGYVKVFPDEEDRIDRLRDSIERDKPLNNRRNFNGHITGSGIVLSPDRHKIALVYHRLFRLWQQPGGHWEGDYDPLAAAKRETTEETGLKIISYLPVDSDAPLVPLDIDTHQVLARPEKEEPPHYHYDWRYVLIAGGVRLTAQAEEVTGAIWVPVDDPRTSRFAICIAKLHELGIA
jgi:8-oxo-dGTP pyrophosphatase MutT (NUDIX family)